MNPVTGSVEMPRGMRELAPPGVIKLHISLIRIQFGNISKSGRWSNTERLCELELISASHLSDRGMFSHTDNMLPTT